jgi:hypothetical protein
MLLVYDSIAMKYPTKLVQRNGYLGDSRITLYYESSTRTHAPRMVMLIKWLGANTLGGVLQGGVIDRQHVNDAKALNSQYIALCDYDHLVLLKFGLVAGPGDIRVTVVPRDSMRLAFLSFLLEACDTVLGKPRIGLS